MIRRIELHNFASHDETEIEFGNGKNVIIGSTGSGKTNILQAIDFAFLGDVPEVNLPELISDKSDATEVILEYDDPRTGQTYRIHRSLKRAPDGKAEHECTVTNLATNEVVKKPEPVKKTLESFGVDIAVWKYIVHVTQGRFGDLLEETQERKNSLDKLFQVSQLENTYQELGRRDGPIGQIEIRKQAKQAKKIRLEEATKPLAQEQKNLEQLRAQREQKEIELKTVKTEYEKLNAISQKSAETLKQFTTTEDAITKSKIVSENAHNQISNILAHLEDILSYTICNELKSISSSQIAGYLQKLSQDIHNTTEERNNRNNDYTTKIAYAAQVKSQLDLATTQKTSMLQEIREVESFLQGKAKEPHITCERCGTILTKTQWNTHLAEKQNSIKDLDKQLETYTNELKTAQVAAEKCNKLLEETRNRLTNLSQAIPLVKQAEQQKLTIEKNQDTELIKTRTKLLGQLRALLALDSSMSDQEVIDHSLSLPKDLKRSYSRIEELTNDLKMFEERVLNPQTKRVEEAKTAQTDLLKLIPEIKLEENKISRLEAIRTSFREIQPIMRKSFVAKITQSANDYLKRLYGEAELENFELTEDYQFLVTRAGYKRHARRLSGGQQVLVSMAFLLALSETLSQLDFLVLDEPTTHLDSDRRRELVSVLESLRRLPQLIIVDHHPELHEAADMAFTVSLSSEGKSQVQATEIH
ncbi:MAG: SMC family ATPase [Candidatus Bathyarchaeia archaeon]|jgi:exonuclease SbcC